MPHPTIGHGRGIPPEGMLLMPRQGRRASGHRPGRNGHPHLTHGDPRCGKEHHRAVLGLSASPEKREGKLKREILSVTTMKWTQISEWDARSEVG